MSISANAKQVDNANVLNVNALQIVVVAINNALISVNARKVDNVSVRIVNVVFKNVNVLRRNVLMNANAN